jgi:cobalt-zinc-cadmium efflux system protein
MLTAERPLLTLHVEVAEGSDAKAVLAAVRAVLDQRFGIGHATVQIEIGGCVDGGGPAGAPLAGPAP